ncbi:MAG: hypothetical protein EAZ15_09805 [Sphingobacteriales bacterium]|nr:MAG: hypothetical protein EAZ15_09805 [Sphingobacteriales bacterium]
MKVLATEAFQTKLNGYSDLTFQPKLLSFIDELSSITDLNTIQNKYEISLNNVFVHKIDDYRIFFSLIDGKTDTIILIDLVKKDTATVRASFKNPKYNSSINPKYNTTINPKYNTTINPKYNTTINPKYNTTINPKYNTTINPKYNTTINPKYNTTINPKYNTTINPKYNLRLNPKLNPSFDGFYIYDLDANPTLYAIKASDKILILYNFNNEAMFYAVAINKGYVIFDINSNEQTSYIISNNSKGYNQFNLNGEWTGFIV